MLRTPCHDSRNRSQQVSDCRHILADSQNPLNDLSEMTLYYSGDQSGDQRLDVPNGVTPANVPGLIVARDGRDVIRIDAAVEADLDKLPQDFHHIQVAVV